MGTIDSYQTKLDATAHFALTDRSQEWRHGIRSTSAPDVFECGGDHRYHQPDLAVVSAEAGSPESLVRVEAAAGTTSIASANGTSCRRARRGRSHSRNLAQWRSGHSSVRCTTVAGMVVELYGADRLTIRVATDRLAQEKDDAAGRAFLSAGAAFVLANSTFRLHRSRTLRDTPGRVHPRTGRGCAPICRSLREPCRQGQL